MSLFVRYILGNDQLQYAEIFRDDFAWGADGFKLKKPSKFDRPFAAKPKNDTSDNPPYHLIFLISNFPPSIIYNNSVVM